MTIRRRTAIQNDVLLGMFSEDLIVQHLSGKPRSSRRRLELVTEEPGFIFSFALAITLFKECK